MAIPAELLALFVVGAEVDDPPWVSGICLGAEAGDVDAIERDGPF
jgi:hypothetical protein